MTARSVECTMQAEATDTRTMFLPLPPTLLPSRRKDQDKFFDFLRSRLRPHPSFTSHSNATSKQFRPQSPTPTVPSKKSSPSTANQTRSRNMAASIAGGNGLCTNAKSSSVPSTLTSLTAFNNANTVHHKRLKVNDSQMTKCIKDFGSLKDQYEKMQEPPPTATLAERKVVLEQLKYLYQRYDKLLHVRRDTIADQDAMLEQALDVPHIMYTDEFERALDMQIAATQDLVKFTDERSLENALMVLNRQHIPNSVAQRKDYTPQPATHQAADSDTELSELVALFRSRLRPSQTRLDHALPKLEALLARYKSAAGFGVSIPGALMELETKFYGALKQYAQVWDLQNGIVQQFKTNFEALADPLDMSDEYAEAFKLHQDAVAVLESGRVRAFRARLENIKAGNGE